MPRVLGHGRIIFGHFNRCGRLGSLEWENQLEAIEGTHTKVRRIKRQKEVFVGLTVTSISHISDLTESLVALLRLLFCIAHIKLNFHTKK